MSGYIRREDRLFDPTTGALVGYIDANGNEQVGYPVSGGGISSLVGDGVDASNGVIVIASVATAGNLTGTFYYSFSFGTALGETAPSPSTPPSTGAIVSKQVSLSSIPVSADPAVTYRKLWRTDGVTTEPKDYQYLATINDNTTTTYVDNTAANSGITPNWTATNRAVITDGVAPIVRASDQTTVLGFGAFGGGTPGYASTAIGFNSQYDNTSGRRNVSVGTYSLENITTGFENVAMGTHAGGGLTTTSGNVLLGYASGSVSNTVGNSNTAVGAYSFSAAATKGVNNVAIGYGTFSSAVGTLNSCIAVGWNAGKYATTSDTVFIDTRDRTNIAGAQDQGLIYGIASGAPSANQKLHLNAATRIGCPAAAGSPAKTVAQLQAAAAGLTGYRDYVTDATTPVFGSAVVGGGAVAVPVFCTGAAWIVG